MTLLRLPTFRQSPTRCTRPPSFAMGAGRYPAELITLSQGSSTMPYGPSQTMLPSLTSLSTVFR